MKIKEFKSLPSIVLVAIFCIIIVIGLIATSNTRVYVEGEGVELIENVINQCDLGGRIIIMDRVNKKELNHIIDRVYDSPELFWVDTTYNAMSIGGYSVVFFSEKYQDIDVKQIEIENAANQIIKSIIKDDMDEYEKALAIHDWICNNVTYRKTDNDSDQDIYGALVLREARCAGYAEAFAYLLNKVGIEAHVISGASIDKLGQSISHAWNLAYIDGEPYYFDITWDDNDEKDPTYWWFGVTSDEFKRSHFPSDGYEWVEATSLDANYFMRNKMYIKSYSATALVRQAVKQGTGFYVKCADPLVYDQTIRALSNRNEMYKLMTGLEISNIDKITYIENEDTYCLFIQIKQKPTVGAFA
jgi:hypothetical protein